MMVASRLCFFNNLPESASAVGFSYIGEAKVVITRAYHFVVITKKRIFASVFLTASSQR